MPRFVGAALGAVQPTGGDAIEVDVTVEAAPSVLYDAVVLPDGDDGGRRSFGVDGRALEFVKDQYRHCKPILAIGRGAPVCCRRLRHSGQRCSAGSRIPGCC